MSKHSELTGAQLHEPKHIAGSTVGDAGKVLTPAGSGASELRFLTPAEVGINRSYGELCLDQNSNVLAVTAATDPALYTTADYVQVETAGLYIGENNGVTFNAPLKGLKVPNTGVYRVNFWMNIASDTVNSKLGVKMKENGNWSQFTSKTDIKEASRVQNISGGYLVTLNADDTVTLWVACDKSANITIQDLRLDVILIEG